MKDFLEFVGNHPVVSFFIIIPVTAIVGQTIVESFKAIASMFNPMDDDDDED